MMNDAIFAFSVGYNCGCISNAREHCNKNPLHSSARPEKGAGLGMGLAITGDGDEEEAILVVPDVVMVALVVTELVAVLVVVEVRICRRLSTISWNGSGSLMLLANLFIFGPVFCYGSIPGDRDVSMKVYFAHTAG